MSLLHNDVYDQGLTIIKSNCCKIAVCATDPADAVGADTTGNVAAACKLAGVTMATNATGAGNSADYTIQDGAVSGRRLTVTAKTNLPVSHASTAYCVVLYSTGATGTIYAKATCVTQNLASTANTVTIPTWDIELRDPS